MVQFVQHVTNWCRNASIICCIRMSDAAHGVGGYIISDGGIVVPGDLEKP